MPATFFYNGALTILSLLLNGMIRLQNKMKTNSLIACVFKGTFNERIGAFNDYFVLLLLFL